MTTHHVLWTGGWDSTYRVLELALVQGERVQPHYLIDPERASTPYELAAMKAIRSAALDRGAVITEVDVGRVDAVSLSAEAEAAHRDLVERFQIGSQHLWLAEYARQRQIGELELCIHRDDRAYAAVASARDTMPLGSIEVPESQLMPLLDIFSFPILDLTKPVMRERSVAYGFDDLMELTWFCHAPTRSGRPCGFCNPCRWTMQEGLAYRLPWSAKMIGRIGHRVIPILPSFRLRRTVRQLLTSA